jgi:outer membrane protein TolC
MMKKKIFISVISVLTLALFVSCASAKTKEEVISGDARLVSGDWVALAQMYPIPDAAGDVVMKEPTPELLGEWWKSMGDDTLTNLIDTALRNNRDLLTARSKVVQARAALGINKAAILPWLDSTDYWQRARNSEATYPAAGGSPNNVFHLGIDASWEIDVFGGKRQTIKAGAAAMEAQYASLYSAWVSLSAEIASDYVSLRTLQERLAVATRTT